MRAEEIDAVAEALGRPAVETRPLAGGFSHETCLLALAGGNRVVVRLGGPDPAIDAANMTRFSDDYPAGFTEGLRSGFARHQPTGLPRALDWAYLGRVLDMFALSDLVTRPAGHPVADQAAGQIRRWITDGVPGQPG